MNVKVVWLPVFALLDKQRAGLNSSLLGTAIRQYVMVSRSLVISLVQVELDRSAFDRMTVVAAPLLALLAMSDRGVIVTAAGRAEDECVGLFCSG